MQAIPGDHRLMAVAAAHHVLGHTGSLIVLDLKQPDDDSMSQVRRFTPDIGFPETGESVKGQNPSGAQPLACPWPLNINFALAGSDRGAVLVDAFGNQTLLVSTAFPTREIIPLRARPRPPVIPNQTAVGHAPGDGVNAREIPKTGMFTLINVYDSLKPWPRDTTITALRIVQIYPKSNTTWASRPQVGVASETLVRGLVGTVPVESDGSVRFEAPANQLLYFQALDAQGRAVQTMRSGTYLQPGAQVTCLGCHEPKHQAPPFRPQTPLALRQPVRQPTIGPSGSNPVFYPALVQTVLDRQCVSCHTKTRQETATGKKMPPDLSPTPCGVQKAGWINGTTDRSVGKLPDVFYSGQGATTCWTVSYNSLVQYTGKNFGGKPIYYEGRTTPGSFGALNSKLYPLLADGKHHGVKLSAEDMQRLAIWMDLNSNFLGHYLFTEEQSRGILPAMPPTEYFDTSDHPEARIPITPKAEAK